MIILNRKKRIAFPSIEDRTETHTHVNVYLYNVKTLQLSFMRWPRGRRAVNVHVIQIDSLLNSKWSIVKDKVNNLSYIFVTIIISEVGVFKHK